MSNELSFSARSARSVPVVDKHRANQDKRREDGGGRMKTIDTCLASIEIGSVVLGYRALDALTRQNGVRVLEASVAGEGRLLIIAQGEETTLRLALNEMRESADGVGSQAVVDFELIADVDRSVPEALYALAQVPLEEALIVVECETVSGLLASAQALVHSHGMKAIELKVHRSSRGGFGFFTGPLSESAAAVVDVEGRLRVAMRKGAAAVIEKPAPAFREFFNFSGQA